MRAWFLLPLALIGATGCQKLHAGPDPVETRIRLLASLKASNKEVEENYRWFNGEGPATVASAARVLATDKDANVRYWTTAVLGQTHSSAAIKPLESAFSDKSRLVRMGAANALCQIKDPKVLGVIGKAYRSKQISGYDVAQVLAKQGDSRALPLLWQIAAESSEYSQEAAIVGIGAVGSKADVPGLETMATSPVTRVRAAAAIAITRLDPDSPVPRSMVPDLIQRASAKDWMKEYDAVVALGAIRDKRAVPLLQRLLSDPNMPIRREAIMALARVDLADNRELINSHANDPDKQVRGAVRRALTVDLSDDRKRD